MLVQAFVSHLAVEEVKKSDFASHPFEFQLQEQAGRPHLEVLCSNFCPHTLTREEQAVIKEQLVALLCSLVARIVLSQAPRQTIERLFREELALERSVDFTGSFVTVGNVLGSKPKNRLSSWSDLGDRDYSLKRSEPWDADAPPGEKRPDQAPGRRPLVMGQGDPPQELLDHSRVKHTQIQTISLIRESLWEKTDWMGTLFATSPDGSEPPILAPVFRDFQGALQIFLDWRNNLGIRDPQERLRIAIVRGVDKTQPYSYRVVIGSNLGAEFRSADIRYTTVTSRIHKMHPQSNENLERFLQSYKKSREYFLAAAFTEEKRFEPKIIWDNYLIKRDLSVRDAWRIGRNDPDSVAIQEDDEPIIPKGEKKPPVNDLLRWKRELSHTQASIARGAKLKVGRNDVCPCGSGKKYKKCHGL